MYVRISINLIKDCLCAGSIIILFIKALDRKYNIFLKPILPTSLTESRQEVSEMLSSFDSEESEMFNYVDIFLI